MRKTFVTLLWACFGTGVFTVAQGQDLLPIEHFTKYDEFGGIKFSPSGDHAAYMTGKYGRSVLIFISTGDRKRTGGVQCPDGFEFYDFEWVSNTRIVYRIAERYAGMATPSVTGEMLAIDVDSKNQQLIYGYRAGEMQTGSVIPKRQASYATAEIVSPLYGDEKNILIAEMPWKEGAGAWYYNPDAKPSISRLNVFTGNKRKMEVVPLSDASVLVDKDDNVRFAVGLNEKFELAASWKPKADGPWAAFDLPDFSSESVIPRLIAQDNQSVLFTGTREGDAVNALFRLNFATKEVTKVLAFAQSDISYLVYDFAHKEIVGAVSHLEKPIAQWIDKDDRAARLYAALLRAFPDQSIDVVTATLDGKRAIVMVSSDVRPGDFYLFDTQTLKADYLQSAKRWIKPETMRHKEPYRFTARDGVEIHGYLTRPAGSGPHPLVVLPHGGPHGVRDYWDFDWEVQLLANRGYAVLQVNYRGSGGYGDAFEEKGYREWGRGIQDDITDATRWAIKQGETSEDRICIYGASFGGYAALQGAIREPALYRCAIGYAGVYDLELMLSSADIPRSKRGRAYLRTALGDDRNELRERSPVYAADKIQVPVLLIHGKEDWRADFEHAKRMKAALEKHAKQYELMSLSREGHGAYDEETRREVYERILTFLDRHLKSTKSAAN